MNGEAYTPDCSRCEWQGEPSPDMLVALRRADDHRFAAHPDSHAAVPVPGSESYPEDWVDDGDPPDYMSATCRMCGEPIEWDPRNLWGHSA